MAALCRSEQGRRIGHVAGPELAAPGGKLLRAGRIANERADGVVASAQGVDDLRADEPRPARDEDFHASSSKFFQYRLGVGPRWPWYLEPRPSLPYGCSAASVSWTNESWPIFIRW